MRATRLLCCLGAIAALAALAPAARAERPRKVASSKGSVARTNQPTPLHARKAESSKVVTNLPKGEKVVVLDRAGRWLYVRAGGRRGWVTRTHLASKRRKTARRATRTKSWKLANDDRARPAERRQRPRPTPSVDRDAEPAGPPPALRDPRLATSAAVGYRSMATDFSSNGSAGTANYLIEMVALTAAIGGRARLLPHGRVSLEVDGDYRYTYGRPGIHYQSSTGTAGDIPFIQHELDAGASLGIWTKLGKHPLLIAGRGGYHYGAFLVDDVANVGRLASESLAGPVAGAHLRLQPHGSSYQLSARVDALVGATRNQTEGLEDGMSSAASAVSARVGANLPLASGLALTLDYRYQRATTTWSGPSSRHADVTSARRLEVSHLATAGIERGF